MSLSHEQAGLKILAKIKIYILSRAKLKGYSKVTNSSTSCLVAHPRIFKLKGKFDVFLL
jgi:hypothetical protein